MRSFILFVFCWLGLVSVAAAVDPVHLGHHESSKLIGLQTYYLADSTGKLSLTDLQNPAISRRFRPNRQEIPNLPSSQPDYWFRFVWQPDSLPRQYFLEVGFGNIRHIDLYVVGADGRVAHQEAGDALGKRSRPVSFHTYVLPLPVGVSGSQTVYIHIENRGVHSYFPLVIWEETAFFDHSQWVSLLWGFYWGILILMFLYHTIIWLYTRNRGYLYLAGYLLSYLFYESARGSNIGARYLWPNAQWFIDNNFAIFSAITIIAFTLFYSYVLNLRHSALLFWQLLRGLSLLSVVLLIAKLTGLLPVPTQLVAILSSFPLVLIMLMAGIWTWRRGQPSARFYVIASMCYAVGFTVFVLNRANILPGMDFGLHYSQNIGSLFEFLFMAIGLANYVRAQQRQRVAEEHKRMEVERAALAEQLRQREEVDMALIDGQIQERRRVADELHDHLGSVLFSVRTRLTEFDSAEFSPQLLESLLNTVRDAYDDVRMISHNLWPDELEKRGFGLTLQQFINSLNRSGKTRFVLQLSGLEENLSRNTKFHLYCICLELVNNILKHAQASEASIRFLPDQTNPALRLSVRDDGIGFRPTASDGRGLRTIRDRLDRLGGTFSYSELPEGEGTWVQIRVPV